MADHPPDPTPADAADRAYAEYVTACDEALAAGLPPPPPPSADLAARCEKARSALALLDRLRDAAALPQTLAGGFVPSDPAATFYTGERVGKYEVIRELGRGGMGVVYLAHDPDLDMPVAVKRIAGGGADRDYWLARFRAEGRLLARLAHPNVVRVHKAGEADGAPFLVMEYVDGPTLHRHLDGQPMPPREAAELVAAVARAVAYAHSQGVIHRDLKPANILLAGDRGQGAGTSQSGLDRLSPVPCPLIPKVTDFGLATAAGTASDLTRTGELIGTPGYLAPEVVSGAEVGPGVDVYGLGAVLYECLTGRAPFVGANLAVTLLRVQHSDPVPPRQLNPDVPRDLETICLACLRKEPARRYPSAAAVADDLAAFLAGRPIQARPVGRVEAALKWARRNRAVAAFAAVAVAALVAGTAVAAYFAVVAGNRAEREAAAATAAGVAEDEARQAQAAAVAAKEASDLLAARFRYEDAVRRAEAGDVADGLRGMAESLRLAPPRAADFRRAVRLGFAAWGRQLPVLRSVTRPWADRPKHPWVRPVGPDGTTLAAWALGQPLRFLDAATGRPTGAAIDLVADEWPLTVSADGGLLLTRHGDGSSAGWSIRLRRLPGGEAVGGPVPVPALPGRAAGPDLGSAVLSQSAVMTGGIDTAPWWGPRRFWDAAAGTPLPLTVPDAGLAAVRLVWAADGAPAAVIVRREGSGEGAEWRAEFRDVATGAPLAPDARLDPRGDPHVRAGGRVVMTVAGDESFGPAGDGSVAWWEVGTGRPLGRWQPGRPAWPAVLTPDGQTLVGYGSDGRARLFDPDTGLQRGGDLPLPDGLPAWEAGGAFPGGPVLFTLDAEGVLRGWETRHVARQATAAARPRSPGRPAPPFPVAVVSPSGRYALLSAHERGDYARLVDTASGEPVGPPLRLRHRGLIAFAPDERAVASASLNFWVGGPQVVEFHDPATGRPLAPPLTLPTYALGLAFSPDGRTLAVARLGGTTLVEVATGRVLRELREDTCVGAVAFLPDGRLVAAGRTGWDGLGAGLRLWDAAGGEPAGDFRPLGEGLHIPQVRVAGGRAVLAFTAGSRATAVMGSASGELRPGPRLPARAEAVAARADGAVVAVGAADGSVRQWDVTTGEPVGPPMGQPAPVTGLDYAPDGRLLAAACRDRAVRVWDAAMALPVGPPLAHAGNVTGVRFAPDGRTVVTVTDAGEVRRWPLPDLPPDDPEALAAWAAAAAGDAPGGPGLLAPAAWAAHTADLRRRWPGGAAALEAVRAAPAAGDAAWHDGRARDAEAAGNEFAAVWHLARLVRLRPDDWRVHARLADARRASADPAAADAADTEARERADPAAWAEWTAHRSETNPPRGK